MHFIVHLNCFLGKMSTIGIPIPASTNVTSKPFNFLDLPQELQDHVYRFHLQDVAIVIHDWRHVEIKDDTYLQFRKLPDLALERACKATCRGSRKMRSNLWPRHLIIDGVDDLGDVLYVLTENHKYLWLRGHIDTIMVRSYEDHFILGSTWQEVARAFPQLRSLDLCLDIQEDLFSFNHVSSAHAAAKSSLEDNDYVHNLYLSNVRSVVPELQKRVGKNSSVRATICRQYVMQGRYSVGCREAFTQVPRNFHLFRGALG